MKQLNNFTVFVDYVDSDGGVNYSIVDTAEDKVILSGWFKGNRDQAYANAEDMINKLVQRQYGTYGKSTIKGATQIRRVAPDGSMVIRQIK